jgi:hypothetical protein
MSININILKLAEESKKINLGEKLNKNIEYNLVYNSVRVSLKQHTFYDDTQINAILKRKTLKLGDWVKCEAFSNAPPKFVSIFKIIGVYKNNHIQKDMVEGISQNGIIQEYILDQCTLIPVP